MGNSQGDCRSGTVATQASPRAGSRLGHSVSVNYRNKERALEQLARMFCEQDEFSPDDRIPTTDINDKPCTYPRWKEYLDQARKAYRIVETA